MKFKTIAISTNLSCSHRNIYKSLYFKKLLNLYCLKNSIKELEISQDILLSIKHMGEIFLYLKSLSKNNSISEQKTILSNKFKQNIKNIRNFDTNMAYIKVYNNLNNIKEYQNRGVIYGYTNLWY